MFNCGLIIHIFQYATDIVAAEHAGTGQLFQGKCCGGDFLAAWFFLIWWDKLLCHFLWSEDRERVGMLLQILGNRL